MQNLGSNQENAKSHGRLSSAGIGRGNHLHEESRISCSRFKVEPFYKIYHIILKRNEQEKLDYCNMFLSNLAFLAVSALE